MSASTAPTPWTTLSTASARRFLRRQVQEFQLILSNYNAEYGRATGGVINIVTKSGGNEFHGDAFGFFRNRSFQARNAFSGAVDSNGVLQPTKRPNTRAQSGSPSAARSRRTRLFSFSPTKYTQREETGLFKYWHRKFRTHQGIVPCIPVPLSLTGAQLAFYQAPSRKPQETELLFESCGCPARAGSGSHCSRIQRSGKW